MKKGRNGIFLLVVLLLFGSIALTSAQTDGAYQLVRWVVAGGGTAVSNDSYTLDGTLGQPEATTILEGEGYQLSSGFWFPQSAPATPPPPSEIALFLPIIK